jgi:hypothetical protein
MPIEPRLTYGAPVMTSTSEGKPRRYGRSTKSRAVGVHLWPDVMMLIEKHAEEHQLTPSGAVHDCLRRFFKLPTIH